MSLTDISKLGNELKDYFLQNKNWSELTFNDIDKANIGKLSNVEVVESHSIKFHTDNNIVFIPSQYISFALKVKPFAIELKKYTDAFEDLKNINDKNILGGFINDSVDLSNKGNFEERDLELFKKMFSSETSLNFGAKAIINGSTNDYRIRSTSDFFGSVILKIINVPDASSAKLGSLIYNLTENPDIYDYLENRFNESQQSEFEKSPLKKAKQIIYYGAPGTGKSYKVDNEIKKLNSQFYERITFHPEFDHASFVGGYKPVSIDAEYNFDNGDKYMQHEVHYKFVPQAFTNIYVKAWNDQENQYYLAIEEINRGNCAEIFGDIFQLLDRNSNYTVSPSNELKEYLNTYLTNKDGIINGLKLPPNLSILATMNTSDQSLFPMDSAFKRRWDWEYIPICYDNIPENESFGYEVIIDEKHSFKWIDFIKNINAVIKSNPNLGMDKCIGNYFIKSNSKEITLKEFINKAIFYLWNDVFKDEDSSDSIFDKGISYEDFFPIETNGKEEVKKILNDLDIKTFVKVNL